MQQIELSIIAHFWDLANIELAILKTEIVCNFLPSLEAHQIRFSVTSACKQAMLNTDACICETSL